MIQLLLTLGPPAIVFYVVCGPNGILVFACSMIWMSLLIYLLGSK